jgi:hypothetical protein
MIRINAILKKFDKQGEKTGWTYVEIPASLSQELLPGTKTSFRVKGKLDQYPIKAAALLPMGQGNFILPVNAAMRRAIGKSAGAMVALQLQVDKEPVAMSEELMSCLNDEPKALQQFKAIPPSHQKYYSKWIDSAKTSFTKAKRIALTINALLKKMSFSEMMREQKNRLDK